MRNRERKHGKKIKTNSEIHFNLKSREYIIILNNKKKQSMKKSSGKSSLYRVKNNVTIHFSRCIEYNFVIKESL